MSSPGFRGPLVYLVCLAQEAIQATLQVRLHQAGFTDLRVSHECVFRYLDPAGTRLSALADGAGISKQSMGEHVDHLTDAGYLDRVADPTDRRAKLICPTERGLAVKATVRAAFEEMDAALSNALGADGLRQTRDALNAFLADFAQSGALEDPGRP